VIGADRGRLTGRQAADLADDFVRIMLQARIHRAARIYGVQELLLPLEEALVERDGGGGAGYRYWDDKSARLDTSSPFWEHSYSHLLTPQMALLEDLE
jgi:hypothetical protein